MEIREVSKCGIIFEKFSASDVLNGCRDFNFFGEFKKGTLGSLMYL